MKKIFLVLVLSFLLVGCGSINNEKINEFVKDSDYALIINKLDESITKITMFPTEEAENEFIYYVKAIIDNKNKFASDELDEIYNKLLINYNFEYNSLGYTFDDFQNDLNVIEK